MVISAASTRSAMKAPLTILLSVSGVSGRFRNLKRAMRSQRPPSRAGIGRTFIQASEIEMMAARRRMLVSPV